jgi:hypothetical protein
MDQLKKNNLISKEVFAFYFSETHNFVTLGNYEKYLYQGDVNQSPRVGNDGMWRVNVDSVSAVHGKTTTALATK